MSSPVVILTDASMILHDPGPGHPERPARLRAIHDMLDELPANRVQRAKPRAATRAQIGRVHDPKYIDFIDSLRGQSARLDADTAVSPASVDAAHLAAGAAIDAVEAVVARPRHRGIEASRDQGGSPSSRPLDASMPHALMPLSRAFALVRPPGHHAERDRAMGFCLFNNIAVAAAHAINELGCQRVLIVDWDVHHGNATQHMFENRSDVLFFSSHEWPMYPGTGALDEHGIGAGKGFTVNAPIPAGMDDAAMVALYQRVLVPIADTFRPDLVLVSAGFDAHLEDPLAGLRMTDLGFAALCGMVRDIADRHAHGRLALILEGGYSLAALTRSVRACLEVMGGAAPPAFGPPGAESAAIIDQICDAHRQFWPMIR